MSAENHETVLYYKILATLKLPELKAGIELIDTFLEEFPESEFLPELLYSKADVMMKLGEKDSSTPYLCACWTLLKMSRMPVSGSVHFGTNKPGIASANRFYAEGDYSVALRIYQGMVELSEQPSWRIPVLSDCAVF